MVHILTYQCIVSWVGSRKRGEEKDKGREYEGYRKEEEKNKERESEEKKVGRRESRRIEKGRRERGQG